MLCPQGAAYINNAVLQVNHKATRSTSRTRVIVRGAVLVNVDGACQRRFIFVRPGACRAWHSSQQSAMREFYAKSESIIVVAHQYLMPRMLSHPVGRPILALAFFSAVLTRTTAAATSMPPAVSGTRHATRQTSFQRSTKAAGRNAACTYHGNSQASSVLMQFTLR